MQRAFLIQPPIDSHPLFTLQRATRQVGRFVRQSGGISYFGLLNFLLEPLPQQPVVVLENGVEPEKLPREFVPPLVEAISHITQQVSWRIDGQETAVTVIGYRATIIDAAFHQVDSNELSYKMAAKLALHQGFAAAGLRRWVADSKIGRSASDDLAKRVAQHRQQFVDQVTAMEQAAWESVLKTAAFQQHTPTLYVRQSGNLQHLVQFSSRWHGQLTIRLGILSPAVAKLLSRHDALVDQLNDFYATLVMTSLSARLPETIEPLLLDVYVSDEATAAWIGHHLAAHGLPFLAQLDSVTAVLSAAENGRIKLGSEKTAALLHVSGQTTRALTLIQKQLDEWRTEPNYHGYFANRLKTLQEKLKQQPN